MGRPYDALLGMFHVLGAVRVLPSVVRGACWFHVFLTELGVRGATP